VTGPAIRAVVLGGAKAVWEELAELQKMCTPQVIVAVNHAGRDFEGHVDHWATLHPAKMSGWIEERRRSGRPPAGTLWTAISKGRRLGLKVDLPFNALAWWGGSSGLLGTEVALTVADQVVLCGIPMTREGQHYDKLGPWREAEKYRKDWRAHEGELRGRVKSMSGWTAEQLGRPDAAWIEGRSATGSDAALRTCTRSASGTAGCARETHRGSRRWMNR
jgi:hypothetical protein